MRFDRENSYQVYFPKTNSGSTSRGVNFKEDLKERVTINAGLSEYGIIINANDCRKTTEYSTLPSKNGGDTSNDSSNDPD